MRLYCVELLLARYFLFYVCRGQFHQSYQLAWQKDDYTKYHCTIESMMWKNCVNIQCEEKTLWSWPIWQNCCQENNWGSKTMSKGSRGPKCTKTGQRRSGTKPFGLKNQSLKYLGRTYVAKIWWKSYHHLYHTNHKVWSGGAFANCKVMDLHQVKGKLNQTGYDSILQHHAIPSGTWLVSQRFILKNIYL